MDAVRHEYMWHPQPVPKLLIIWLFTERLKSNEAGISGIYYNGHPNDHGLIIKLA